MTADPLPSWNEGVNTPEIVDFVTAVTDEGGDRFVLLRLYSPLEPFFDKSWRLSEIELVS